ncbi:MAG: hypothetical protein ABJB55_09625 [Actinomycetota bacterium]
MTERWRKKLEGLDGASPSDDVFERAKQGPMHSDEALPGPRMSTRVVTIVVAFLVFALAISAFAIPALRMGNTSAGGGTAVLVPLWPTQDADQLDQLQSDAAVGNADWALSPEAVAKRFAQDVMGWQSPVVKPNVHSFCAFGAEPDSLSTPASPVACADLPVGGWSAPGGVPLEDPAAAPSSGAGKLSTLSYEIYPCDTDACLVDLGPEIVQVYQPLRRGDGAIWTVLQAKSPRITLSVLPAQIVHNGSTVSAGFLTNDVPTLAYSSCGSAAASSAFHAPSGSDAKGIALDVSLSGGANCTDQEPGYVWAATAKTALGTETGQIGADPLQGQPPSSPGLLGLTAVPVTMVSASLPAETTPPKSPPLGLGGSPSMLAVAMTTYTDPFGGWTIDVPQDWTTKVIQTSGSGTQGAQFMGENMSIQVSTQTAPSGSPPPGLTLPATDDSQFPLVANDLLTNVEGGLGGTFWGDGQTFSVTVLSPNLPEPLPEPERSILMHMIGSISFKPWTVGEIRNQWVAIPTPTGDVSWITVEGGLYMLFKTPDGYKLYGAISCGGKPPRKTSSRADGFAVLDCPDGTSWEMDAGGASGGDGSGEAVWNDPPPQWPVVTAHDGTLIAWVLPGVFPPGTGGSSPAPG